MKVSLPPIEEEVEDTSVWFTTHHWVGTPLHTQVLQHFLGKVEVREDRQMNRGTEGDKEMEGQLHRQMKGEAVKTAK